MKCSQCNKIGVDQRCGQCKEVYYCNRNCQTAHWKRHKKKCKRLAKLKQKSNSKRDIDADESSHRSDGPIHDDTNSSTHITLPGALLKLDRFVLCMKHEVSLLSCNSNKDSCQNQLFSNEDLCKIIFEYATGYVTTFKIDVHIRNHLKRDVQRTIDWFWASENTKYVWININQLLKDCSCGMDHDAKTTQYFASRSVHNSTDSHYGFDFNSIDIDDRKLFWDHLFTKSSMFCNKYPFEGAFGLINDFDDQDLCGSTINFIWVWSFAAGMPISHWDLGHTTLDMVRWMTAKTLAQFIILLFKYFGIDHKHVTMVDVSDNLRLKMKNQFKRKEFMTEMRKTLKKPHLRATFEQAKLVNDFQRRVGFQ